MLRWLPLGTVLGLSLSACSNNLYVKSFSGETIAVDSSTVKFVPDSWKTAVDTFNATAEYFEGAARQVDKRLSDCIREPAAFVEICRASFSPVGSGWRKLAQKDLSRSRIASSLSGDKDIQFISLVTIYSNPNGIKEIPERIVIVCSKPKLEKTKAGLISDSLFLITSEEESGVWSRFGREACVKYTGFADFLGEFESSRLSEYRSDMLNVTGHGLSK